MTSSGIRVDDDRIHVGKRLVISFQRTLRIPDDGRAYPLPPGLGCFPVFCAADYIERLPREWQNDFFIPMYRREALWIALEGAWWKPNAVKVGIGGINAISGTAWNSELRGDPQNYVVAPDQPWLDGINSGEETVRQFVAVSLGEGHTVEAQITGEERVGGIQIVAFDPFPGKFPDIAPTKTSRWTDSSMPLEMPQTLGLGVGGTMRQKIYPDKHGIETWDPEPIGSFFVHLINVAEFRAITGAQEPTTPVDATAYSAAGLPWFELLDEEEGDIDPAEMLARIRSIQAMEQRSPDKGIDVSPSQVRKVRGNLHLVGRPSDKPK